MTTVVIDAGPPSTDTDAATVATLSPILNTPIPMPTAAGDAGAATSGPDFYSCGTDTDCVAVPRAGCCHNGHKEAVNTQSVDAYKTSVTCPKHRLCPQYVIMDNRVARCAPDTKKCVMVAPTP